MIKKQNLRYAASNRSGFLTSLHSLVSREKDGDVNIVTIVQTCFKVSSILLGIIFNIFRLA